jgi:hypothetical protein
MSHGPLVIFKSTPDMWEREHDGRKPNTYRFAGAGENRGLDEVVTTLALGGPATIEIVNTATGEPFFRRLTDITFGGALLGKQLWILSWRHEDGPGEYEEESDE